MCMMRVCKTKKTLSISSTYFDRKFSFSFTFYSSTWHHHQIVLDLIKVERDAKKKYSQPTIHYYYLQAIQVSNPYIYISKIYRNGIK